jgi:hypothetical protein
MCGDGKTGASSKKDADMDDLFGDDDEEDADEAAATKARRQRMEQARKLFIRYGFRPVTTGAAKVGQSEAMPCYYILESLA